MEKFDFDTEGNLIKTTTTNSDGDVVVESWTHEVDGTIISHHAEIHHSTYAADSAAYNEMLKLFYCG
jgi:hypothetical protein